MVANHEHVQMLIDGVYREWACWVGRGGEHVRFSRNSDNVRCMSSAGTFGMEGMNGAAFEGSNGILDKSGFVQGVGMNSNLNVQLVCDAQASVNRGGGGSPVLV